MDLKRKNEGLTKSSSDQFTWLKQMWKYCNQETRRDIKAAIEVAKDEFPKGTLRGIRDTTGINFSNPPTASNAKIEEFAHRNSFEVPDEKKEKKNIRFMRHMKTTLHQQFLLDNPTLDCLYNTFCLYFPKNIIKPGINSYGSCLCEDCQNFSLKQESLRRAKLLPDQYEVDLIIKSVREGNDEEEIMFLDALKKIKDGEFKDKVISYFVWEDDKKTIIDDDGNVTKTKKMMRKNHQVTASTLAERTTSSYIPLKEHLDRDFIIKNYIRSARMEALMDSSVVCLTVDWSENGTLIVPGEVQSAYFGRTSYSIHSGYCYKKDNCRGFAMLTDQNNHKAESIWAGMTPKLESFISQGVDHFYIYLS